MNPNDDIGTREADAVAARYARRDAPADAARYSVFNDAALEALQERQRFLLALLREQGVRDLSGLRMLDLGCGAGQNLLDVLRWGAAPQHLTGIDLLPERIAAARAVLPPAVRLLQGDALGADVPEGSQDIVTQFTVFSSVLDAQVRDALAARMWAWLKPGGLLVWYDFTVDNPRNPDVRGVPLAQVRAWFAQARVLRVRRLTLAPPLARRLPRALRRLVDWPPLRTHVLVVARKPS